MIGRPGWRSRTRLMWSRCTLSYHPTLYLDRSWCWPTSASADPAIRRVQAAVEGILWLRRSSEPVPSHGRWLEWGSEQLGEQGKHGAVQRVQSPAASSAAQMTGAGHDVQQSQVPWSPCLIQRRRIHASWQSRCLQWTCWALIR